MQTCTPDERVGIVKESCTSNNIAALCRTPGVSVSNFYNWRDKFIESEKKGFYKSSRFRDNEYHEKNNK